MTVKLAFVHLLGTWSFYNISHSSLSNFSVLICAFSAEHSIQIKAYNFWAASMFNFFAVPNLGTHLGAGFS